MKDTQDRYWNELVKRHNASEIIAAHLQRQWRIDAVFWAYLSLLDDYPSYERARANLATQLLELGVVP